MTALWTRKTRNVNLYTVHACLTDLTVQLFEGPGLWDLDVLVVLDLLFLISGLWDPDILTVLDLLFLTFRFFGYSCMAHGITCVKFKT
jgi:formate-dependent nitrite reductase membrane component NrfD